MNILFVFLSFLIFSLYSFCSTKNKKTKTNYKPDSKSHIINRLKRRPRNSVFGHHISHFQSIYPNGGVITKPEIKKKGFQKFKNVSIGYETKSSEILLFQLVDPLNFPIWINWWIINLSTRNIPYDWEIYLACFGYQIDNLLRLFYPKGCSKVYPMSPNIEDRIFLKTEKNVSQYSLNHIMIKEYFNKLNLLKWTSFFDAMNLKKNIFHSDLESFFLKNPDFFFELKSTHWDFILLPSTQPRKLEYSINWGPIRFDSNILFLRYSKSTHEFFNLLIKRIKNPGRNQHVEFNRLFTRSCLMWQEDIHQLSNLYSPHSARLNWFHQTDENFLVFNEQIPLYNYLEQSKMCNRIYHSYNSIVLSKKISEPTIDKAMNRHYFPQLFTNLKDINHVNISDIIARKLHILLVDEISVFRECRKKEFLSDSFSDSTLLFRPLFDYLAIVLCRKHFTISDHQYIWKSIKFLDSLSLWAVDKFILNKYGQFDIKLFQNKDLNGSNYINDEDLLHFGFKSTILSCINFQRLEEFREKWIV